MNVLYSTSHGSKTASQEELATIIVPAYISSLGHHVQIFSYDPREPNTTSKFDDIADKILAADVFIGEMSRASQTLGFQLSYAISNTKPSLYLYYSAAAAQPGSILSKNPSRLLKIKSYTETNYEKAIDSFMKFAIQQQTSVRTSFMSTKRIDRYVKQVSEKQGISKGEVIRQILNAAASSDDQ